MMLRKYTINLIIILTRMNYVRARFTNIYIIQVYKYEDQCNKLKSQSKTTPRFRTVISLKKCRVESDVKPQINK